MAVLPNYHLLRLTGLKEIIKIILWFTGTQANLAKGAIKPQSKNISWVVGELMPARCVKNKRITKSAGNQANFK